MVIRGAISYDTNTYVMSDDIFYFWHSTAKVEVMMKLSYKLGVVFVNSGRKGFSTLWLVKMSL